MQAFFYNNYIAKSELLFVFISGKLPLLNKGLSAFIKK